MLTNILVAYYRKGMSYHKEIYMIMNVNGNKLESLFLEEKKKSDPNSQ